MQRRHFITLLGGTAVGWPLAALAQQGERMRHIGVILPAAADNAEFQAWVGAFLQGLQQSGWSIGQNVRIDTRWATSDAAVIRKHAAELAALAPDVILAHGSMTVGPLLEATRTVSIVFPVIADPVGHFPPMPYSKFIKPVAWPPGRARLSTKPARHARRDLLEQLQPTSRILTGTTSTLSAGATAWIAANCAGPETVAASRSTATRPILSGLSPHSPALQMAA
jgi:hypothetical protein